VLTTTKSGTDRFHGTAFETYNSQGLNALGYFTLPGTTVPAAMFNYFGGSVGGPVLIPKLFDGRKRHLFFFTDWEDTLSRTAEQLNSDVPTAQERLGNFSGLTPEGTATGPIYDPATTQIVNGQVVRTAFQGNMLWCCRWASTRYPLAASSCAMPTVTTIPVCSRVSLTSPARSPRRPANPATVSRTWNSAWLRPRPSTPPTRSSTRI
jgi:hypothetical protein